MRLDRDRERRGRILIKDFSPNSIFQICISFEFIHSHQQIFVIVIQIGSLVYLLNLTSVMVYLVLLKMSQETFMSVMRCECPGLNEKSSSIIFSSKSGDRRHFSSLSISGLSACPCLIWQSRYKVGQIKSWHPHLHVLCPWVCVVWRVWLWCLLHIITNTLPL